MGVCRYPDSDRLIGQAMLGCPTSPGRKIIDLSKHNLSSLVPLRGGICTSGDLSPLSYITGAIQGDSTIRILSHTEGNVLADMALSSIGLEPLTL